jgi:LuxR family maltose regulon positive regulatory protein
MAWLALDEGDNVPFRFLAYFVRALEATLAGANAPVCPAAGEMLSSAQTVPLPYLLTALINDLSEISEPFAIVLDDYQFITMGNP